MEILIKLFTDRFFLSILMMITISVFVHTQDLGTLDIHVNHRGSAAYFYSLELNSSILINIDAHSDMYLLQDAVSIPSEARCDNWISCLPKKLVTNIIWVSGFSELSDISDLEKFVLSNWRHQRSTQFFQRSSFTNLVKNNLLEEDFIASIDLDFFSKSDHPEVELTIILKYLLMHSNLKALSIAISRPWLPTNQFTAKMIQVLIVNAEESGRFNKIVFHTGHLGEHQNTMKADEYYEENIKIPEFILEEMSEEFIDWMKIHTIIIE